MTVRPAVLSDLEKIQRLQRTCPEAAQWPIGDYLLYDCRVADEDNRVVGFVVTRGVEPAEWEILYMAVDPQYRRRGVGRLLLQEVTRNMPGACFLEVRESNQAARKFYEAMGFTCVGRRQDYYYNPVEPAIVMKFHSC